MSRKKVKLVGLSIIELVVCALEKKAQMTIKEAVCMRAKKSVDSSGRQIKHKELKAALGAKRFDHIASQNLRPLGVLYCNMRKLTLRRQQNGRGGDDKVELGVLWLRKQMTDTR